ncbi:Abortive infection protein [Ruminiclostridium papyrosolvens DSM 2782]|uniref:Abortive infection protein n=1 Tax=Ruminiclostridium papyrosolvens DSM 2782 TaxID=588581 RepID=F1TF20_9FIRM|nr:CPBP family intramembrane glutamic endopeptidase [Ruminiclostridium papyrosolvens]EGD46958.1 Abortive infection protein [Ruminiclostridium papyrosolvens DSM 2782]WES33792.1 CPBP family intramembrane metalloprotease [Ruminiclostridium papyrosolvens DSM 2782]
MDNALIVAVVGYCCMFVWLFIFKQSYKNTYIKNRISLFISSLFGIPASYSYSVFATFLYCALPVISSIVVAKTAKIHIFNLFPLEVSLELFATIILGVVAAMSLVAVFIIVSLKLAPSMDIAGEISKIKWIEGIFQIPKKIAWLLPILSASFEEVFFRGVFLQGLVSNGMNNVIAVIVVTAAFILNQVLLTDTKVQGLVLGFSSVSISIVGCIMFFASGSIIPSMIMHASFAGFYANGNDYRS